MSYNWTTSSLVILAAAVLIILLVIQNVRDKAKLFNKFNQQAGTPEVNITKIGIGK